jgi:hypothetical protein
LIQRYALLITCAPRSGRNKLTLTFNRTRQANITRELIEIVSGAEALRGS